MATATEPDISPTSRVGARQSRPALWALACGVYAGGLWAVACFALSYSDAGAFSRDFSPDGPKAVIAWALLGGGVGCPTGPLVWLIRPRRLQNTLALFLLGPIWGALGCGSAALAIVLLRDLVHPILGSSLAMAAVSAGIGYAGCQLSSRLNETEASRKPPSILAGFGWMFSGGATTGAAWLSGCIFAHLAFGVAPPFELTAFEGALLVACGAAYGAAGGALVGTFRPHAERNNAALTLGFLGAVFGALCGIAAVATIFLDKPYPLLTSALAMSAIGCAAGLSGHQFALTPVPDEDESEAPAVKVEWLLHEEKRPWRVSRPLLRVLPVIAVAVGALAWGAVAENAALCAIAALGAVVAHALYRQEKRLDVLERRSISERDTRPPV